jgi:hypothetical protein
MMKPKYKLGQKVLIPFVVDSVPETSGEFYSLDVDCSDVLLDLGTENNTVYLNETEMQDLIEFSDPTIRKQKLKAKIDKLTEELNKL